MRSAKCVFGLTTSGAFLAVFIFWSIAIWSGDDRWADMAFMAAFPCIILSVATALLWIEK